MGLAVGRKGFLASCDGGIQVMDKTTIFIIGLGTVILLVLGFWMMP
jgi:hypothetical protein